MNRAIAGIFCVCCLLMLLGCGATTQQVPPNQPTALHVTLPASQVSTPLYHPIDKTITDIAGVQKLYKAALALPVLPPGAVQFCSAGIPGLTYHLTFLHSNTVLRTASMDASGCENLVFSPKDIRMTDQAFQTLLQQTVGE